MNYNGSHESHLSQHYMHTQWMKDPVDELYKGHYESHLFWHLLEFGIVSTDTNCDYSLCCQP